MKKTGSVRWCDLRRGLCILLALMLAIQLLPLTARAEETNILKNPSFENDSAEGWDNYGGWTYSGGTASLEIKSSAADWGQSLIQRSVTLEDQYSYTVSATITTTKARSVVIGFESFDNRAHTFDLKADEENKISFTTDKFGTGDFAIYFGLEGDAYTAVGEHTVTVKDISIVKGDRIKAPGEDTENGEEVAEVEGNLLQNGNFANKQDNWEVANTNADVYFNQYRTVFYLKGKTADWEQGLKQTLKLEDGTKYKVSFKVKTDVARTVTVNLKEAGTDVAYTSPVIEAGQETVVTFETDGSVRDGGYFYIYLGGVEVQYPHSVVITDVSVVPMPITFEDDTPNDTPPTAVKSIKDIPADEGVILKDGNFTQGLDHWETWAEDWIRQYDSVHFVPAKGGGMTVQIGADVANNNAWSIQLNQKISLKAGHKYTISFDVTSDKPRAFNVVIDKLYGDDSSFSKMIGLQANDERHVVLNVGELETDALDKTFSFQLGWVSEQEKPNTNITFKNIKIEINGYSDKAVLIPDGDFADGLGEFEASTSGSSGSEITVENGNVLANIKSGTAGIAAISTAQQGDTLSRTVDGMESGADYTLSFVAGAVSGKRDIKVTLPNGENKTYTLTDEAVEYTANFTASGESGQLKFDFSGEDDIICLDTVRLDISGYAEAAGIDAADHDITRLTKDTPPLLSEMAGALSGQDVTLTYETSEANANFKEKITGVKGDGVPVNDYTAEDGKITIPGKYFTVDSKNERQTFNITVSADWYYDAKAIQIVYASEMWKATWSDEFNGTELDESKWGYQNGTGAEYGLDGWGNNEQQYYTSDNLKVEDGLLTITATSGENGKRYDSARIWTMKDDQTTPKFAQTYGRFEAKMKLPAGASLEGLWPAFWLLPVDSVYGGWPLSGEIDIMEARGREGNKADGTIHFGRPWPNDGSSGDTYEWDDPLAITEYHIYSVDWTPEYMSFQVDGEEYYRVNNWYSEDPAQPTKNAFGAPFDQPFYIVLNMAVGGTYDGNREPASGALPAEMCVDYVRVYQMTDTERTAEGYMPAEPEVEAEEIPQGAKDTIIDTQFTNVKKVVHDNNSRNENGWNLLTLEAYGGAADFSTVTADDGTVFGKVNITAAGNQNYAVQLTQKLALYTGNWYTLSFDAYADSNHTVIAKIGGDGTHSWSAYNSVEVPLTQNARHYEYIFQMLNTSDDCSRLELNMNYATGGVYFANVKLEHADGLTINHDVQKAPLDDGNGIYNGSFELGTVDRLAYWHATGGQVVRQKENNAYNHVFKADGEATVYQLGVELLQSDQYVLNADSTGTVYVEVTSADGSVTYLEKHPLSTIASNAFIMPVGVTDKNAKITFTLASGATLDDVFLERTTFNNVDYSGLDCYPLVNGDFEHKELGWGTYNTDLTVQSTTEEGHGSWVGAVAGKKTDHTYDALLSYDKLNLLGGYSYVISFDIKASANAVIDVALEDASYNRAFQHTGIEVSTEWQHHEHAFKLSSDATLSLKFLVGGADENYTLYLDNVVLKLAGAPTQPGAFLPKDYNKLTDDITVPFIGTTEWTKAAKLYLDGKLLSANSYRFEGENLVLNADLFDDDGVYSLSAKTEGYADTPAVELWIYPANGERLINGGFSDGSEGWETYIQNNCGTLDFDSSFLSARYLHAEGDEWGNPAVPWAIQLNQYFPADPGTYTLHFYAESEVERYIMVTVKNVSANTDVIVQKVKMDTTWNEHSFDVTIPSSGTYQLQFFLSAVNPNTDNGYFESGTDYSDYQPHNFYLNGISFLPQNAAYIPSTVKPILTLDVPATATFGSTVTVTAVLEKEPMLESEEEPDGTLTFYVDGSEIESDGNVATLTGLALGEHTVKVVFTPDESETLYEAAEAEAVITVTNSSGGSGGVGGSAQSGPVVSPDGVKGETHRTGGTVTSADIVIPEAAAQTGKVLTAPVEIPGSASSDKAPEISVKVEGEGSARLEIPVKGVTPGTVAVVVNSDGTETVVRDSVVTETGVVLNVSGEMTVKLVDMASNFNDTASVPWALDAIAFASARELISGTAPGTFSPDAKTDRASVVTVLYRLAYEPDADTCGFGDVEEGKWYSDAIAWAQANNVVNGRGDGTFGLSDPVTREQFVVILFNYAKKLGYDVQKRAGLTVYNDVNAVSPWARDAMEWAVAAGLIQGKGNATLDPSGTATRAEMVTLVMRFSELSLDK